MEQFLKFLADPTIQLVGLTLGAIGWIVGIISGWLQVKGYLGQKKLEQGYVAILERAKRDWQGKYTEDQVESMTKELERLEESINKDIPKKARRVFLEDQLSVLTKNMAQSFDRYNQILVELGPHDELLPTQVQNAIEQEIMPKYLEQQMQQKITLSVLGILGLILLLLNSDLLLYSNLGVFLFYILGTISFIIVINYSLEKQIGTLMDKIGREFSMGASTGLLGVVILAWVLVVIPYSFDNNLINAIKDHANLSRWLAESIMSAIAILIIFRT